MGEDGAPGSRPGVERRKKGGSHRKRRPRRPLPGMMLHIDASEHRWFGDERKYELIVILEDATSEIYYAQLVESESTRSMMRALRKAHGYYHRRMVQNTRSAVYARRTFSPTLDSPQKPSLRQTGVPVTHQGARRLFPIRNVDTDSHFVRNTRDPVFCAPLFPVTIEPAGASGLQPLLAKISRLLVRSRQPGGSVALLCLLAAGQDRDTIGDLCRRHQWRVLFAETRVQAQRILGRIEPQIILFDRDAAGSDWREVMTDFAARSAGACIMLVSRVIDDYLWNEVVCNGGYDVLAKPLREADVCRAVRLARSYWTSANQAAKR